MQSFISMYFIHISNMIQFHVLSADDYWGGGLNCPREELQQTILLEFDSAYMIHSVIGSPIRNNKNISYKKGDFPQFF